MAHRLGAAGVFGCVTVLACGGNVETGTSGSSAGGNAGVGGATAGSSGSGGSSSGSGGSSSGSGGSSSGSGGSSAGVGGTTVGTGGSTAGAFENCVSACDRAAALQCPNGGSVRTECLKNCTAIGTRDELCDRAYADVFACLVESRETVICDDGGSAAIRCGPCDDQLSVLSNACGESIKCTF